MGTMGFLPLGTSFFCGAGVAGSLWLFLQLCGVGICDVLIL